jgi:hypothetical protein
MIIETVTTYIDGYITNGAASTYQFSTYDYQIFTQDERAAANKRELMELRARTQHRDIARLNIPAVCQTRN